MSIRRLSCQKIPRTHVYFSRRDGLGPILLTRLTEGMYLQVLWIFLFMLDFVS
jgi:hypothetical protein